MSNSGLKNKNDYSRASKVREYENKKQNASAEKSIRNTMRN